MTAEEEEGALQRELSVPNDRRMWALFRALDRGWTVEELHELTRIDRWFLTQFAQIVELQRRRHRSWVCAAFQTTCCGR